ncbi:hypothetical protein [Salinibius halmophilus]|uniref:hypothetical protein n=1 Tax=Salinibius halmophilus TaxID=1853216 RepID=UPI000E666797|nr:hypothetical protein [Salinibius halmophilus]
MIRFLVPLLATTSMANAVEWQGVGEQTLAWQNNPHGITPAQSAIVAETSARGRASIDDWRFDLSARQTIADPNTVNAQVIASKLQHQHSTRQWRWQYWLSGHSANRINVDKYGEPERTKDAEGKTIDVSGAFNRWQLEVGSEFRTRISANTQLFIEGEFDRRWYKEQYPIRDNRNFNLYQTVAGLSHRLNDWRVVLSGEITHQRYVATSEDNNTQIELALETRHSLASSLRWQLQASIEREFDANRQATERNWQLSNELTWRPTKALTLASEHTLSQPQEKWQTSDNLEGWTGDVAHRIELTVDYDLGQFYAANWTLFSEVDLADDKLDFPNQTFAEQEYLVGLEVNF